MNRELLRCHTVEDMRGLAKSRLPAPLFHYIDGGSGDEWTMERNRSAFDEYVFDPRVLRDVSEIKTKTRLFGRDLDLPLILSPTGMNKLFHHEKELAAARAAQEFGIFHSLSTLGTCSMADVAGVSDGPKIFQVYVLKDRKLMKDFIGFARSAGYDALCLTVDTPVPGARERDWRTGMTMPPKFGPGQILDFLLRPRWLYHYMRDPNISLANVEHRVDALAEGPVGVMQYIHDQFDRSVTWDDAAWLKEAWGGPLIIKGVISTSDAEMCQQIGANGIMISNHGGRQLDGAPAPLDVLPEIKDMVGDRMSLIVDGGIRRGSHMAKALALGADACSVGRPYLYGLAAAGEAGVRHVLELIRTDFIRTMILLGAANLAELKGRVKARA